MLLDADTGLRIRTFEGSRRVPKVFADQLIRPAVFSPDGKTLYAIADHKQKADDSLESRIKELGDFANGHLDFPRRRVLLVWDVATGTKKAEWPLPSGDDLGESLVGVSAALDGKRLFVYGSIRMRVNEERAKAGAPPDYALDGVRGVHVVDALTGKKLATWEGAGNPVGMTVGGKEVITLRNDRTLANASEVTARDAETGKSSRTFILPGKVPSVAISPDGAKVAALGIAGAPNNRTFEIRIWEAATGRELRRLTRDSALARRGSWNGQLVFGCDGQTLFLGTDSGTILRWNLSDGKALPEWSAHFGRIVDLFVRPGKSELLSIGRSDGALRRWEPVSGQALSNTNAYINDVAFVRTPDGTGVVAVDGVGRLDQWDIATGRITKTLKTPGRKNHQLLFAPDGRHLLVAAESGPNTIWDLAAAKQVGEFAPPPKKDPTANEYYWNALHFSPNGRLLVGSKYRRGTWMWTWPEKTLLWHEAEELRCPIFRDDDTLVFSDLSGQLQVRDARTGTLKPSAPVQELPRRVGDALSIYHLAYSHDHRRVVTADDDGVWRVRDGLTGTVLKHVKEGFQYAFHVSFSPSGWLLAVAGDKSVRVYDTASWQLVARFEGHDGTVGIVFFGPDDATLISASGEDGTALVWSLKPPAGREPPDAAELWADLAGDGPALRRAVWAAAQHPEAAIRLFREKWPLPKEPIDAKRIGTLIADLDSPVYAKREAATTMLARLGRRAEAALRKTSTESPSLEVKKRADKILAQLAPPVTAEYSSEDARELRAMWALELAGSAEAQKLLTEWSTAKVGHRLCGEVEAALKRMQGKH
jgi:WD40 repeat protein